MNTIVRALSMMHGANGTTVRWTAAGIQIDAGGAAFPWTDMAFGFSLIAADTVRIYAGTLRIHGIGNYHVDQDDLDLEGAEAWVYLKHKRDHTTTAVTFQAMEPESDTIYLRIPLFQFIRNPGGTYVLSRACNIGDVNLDTPIA